MSAPVKIIRIVSQEAVEAGQKILPEVAETIGKSLSKQKGNVTHEVLDKLTPSAAKNLSNLSDDVLDAATKNAKMLPNNAKVVADNVIVQPEREISGAISDVLTSKSNTPITKAQQAVKGEITASSAVANAGENNTGAISQALNPNKPVTKAQKAANQAKSSILLPKDERSLTEIIKQGIYGKVDDNLPVVTKTGPNGWVNGSKLVEKSPASKNTSTKMGIAAKQTQTLDTQAKHLKDPFPEPRLDKRTLHTALANRELIHTLPTIEGELIGGNIFLSPGNDKFGLKHAIKEHIEHPTKSRETVEGLKVLGFKDLKEMIQAGVKNPDKLHRTVIDLETGKETGRQVLERTFWADVKIGKQTVRKYYQGIFPMMVNGNDRYIITGFLKEVRQPTATISTSKGNAFSKLEALKASLPAGKASAEEAVEEVLERYENTFVFQKGSNTVPFKKGKPAAVNQ